MASSLPNNRACGVSSSPSTPPLPGLEHAVNKSGTSLLTFTASQDNVTFGKANTHSVSGRVRSLDGVPIGGGCPRPRLKFASTGQGLPERDLL